MKPRLLSLVIPVYNEKNIIRDSLIAIKNFLNKNKINYEIIIVDDGSDDNCISKINDLLNNKIKILVNNKNKGKGFSIKKGVLASKGDYVLFTDADLSTPIAELRNLMQYVPQYDIVISSRKTKGSTVVESQPVIRVWAGNFFPLLVKNFVVRGINDTQCGFKLFKLSAAKKIFKKLTIERFAFDVELLFIAKKNNLKIKEIGVIWHNNTESKLNLIRDSAKMFVDLIKIRLNNFLGYY